MAEIIKTSSLPAGGEFDFYGKRYATFGNSIEIYFVENEEANLLSSISTLGQKANCLSWCHPCYGSYFAAGCDNTVIIWKESNLNCWEISYEYQDHQGKIMSIAWSPSQFGLNLLVGSADQCVSIITNTSEDTWHSCIRKVHNKSIISVSWINVQDKKKFVTAAENIKIWECINGEFKLEDAIDRNYSDVKANNYGLMIAACGKEGAFIWTKETSGWRCEQVQGADGYMLQWSVNGTILVVCSEDLIYVIRKAPGVGWIIAQTINQDGKIEI